jgi:hypothetical protein
MTREVTRIPAMPPGTRLVPLLTVVLCATALGQAPPPGRIEPIPDPVKLPLTEVPYVHPLWKALDAPARLGDRPAPADFKSRTTLFTTLRVDEKGKVSEGMAVQPPLAALNATAAALIPKWRFAPARRGGAPAVTWATYGVELEVSLEKGGYSAFSFLPVAKDETLEAIPREFPGENWTTRYPHDIFPKDPTAFSIEDVDVLPVPEKTSWSFSSARVRSRVTALVEISAAGTVRRIVPTGSYETLVLAWVRQNAASWKLSPAQAGGKAVDSWMALDTTLEYTIDDAREKGKRSIKKHLRAVPPA